MFSWALVTQHRAYDSSAFDLGFFDQIIWNTSHGRWFETTFLTYNFAGEHFDPVLLLYAGIYRFWPRVEILLLSEAAAAAWAAVPLYVAARHVLRSSMAALLLAAAYLLAPHLHGAVLFDFHPEVIGILAIFSSFALLLHGRPGWALIMIASLFLLKEETVLTCAGFAFIFWLRGYRRQALGLLIAAALYAVLVIGILMPAERGGEPSDLQGRYGYLGATAGAILVGTLHHPALVWTHLTGRPQLQGISYVLGTQALLPLAGPAVFAAGPELGADLLTTHPPQHDLTLHYVALPFALLLVATVLGAESLAFSSNTAPLWRLMRVPAGRRALVLAGALLLCEATGWLAGSPLGLRFEAQRHDQTAHTAAVARVLRAVPPDVSVSAQSGLLPHLSQRRQIWEFPMLNNAGYVVVDRKAWRSSQSTDSGYDAVLAALPQLGYCQVREEDGVALYARGAPCASR